MAGRCRTAGTPQVRPCRLGRGLLVCAVLRTRQDRGWAPAQPARGMPRAHAADTPHSDTAPPLTVSRDLVGPCHAWMTPSNSNISTIDRKASTRGVDLHLPVDQGRHPPRAGHAFPTDRGNLSKAGWVRLRGVSAMGPRHASGGLGRTPNPGLAVCAGQRTRASGDRAYMDVLAAAPATGPTPPTLRKPAFDSAVASAVAVEVAGQRPALPLRRVQGAALPANPP